jgi:hypothetical protein
VSLIPDLGLVDLPSNLRVVDTTPRVCRLIQLAYRTTNVERPAVVAVREALVEIVDELGLGRPPTQEAA